jgi:hypothetical protein
MQNQLSLRFFFFPQIHSQDSCSGSHQLSSNKSNGLPLELWLSLLLTSPFHTVVRETFLHAQTPTLFTLTLSSASRWKPSLCLSTAWLLFFKIMFCLVGELEKFMLIPLAMRASLMFEPLLCLKIQFKLHLLPSQCLPLHSYGSLFPSQLS